MTAVDNLLEKLMMLISPLQRNVYPAAIFKAGSRRLISWLLILVMAALPFQSTLAMHSDPGQYQQYPRVLLDQSQDMTTASFAQNCIVSFCHSFSTCAAHLNCNPIKSSSPLRLDVQARFFYLIATADEPVATRFPELQKRPPRS